MNQMGPLRRRRTLRTEQGSLLVEFLVALVLMTTIALVLFQMSSDSLRYLTTSRNDLFATEIVDELLEQTIVMGYAGLRPYAGTEHLLKLNRDNIADLGPTIRQRPLLLDRFNKVWKSTTSSSANLANAEISYSLSQEVNSTITVDIRVSWQDGYGNHSREDRIKLTDHGA